MLRYATVAVGMLAAPALAQDSPSAPPLAQDSPFFILGGPIFTVPEPDPVVLPVPKPPPPERPAKSTSALREPGARAAGKADPRLAAFEAFMKAQEAEEAKQRPNAKLFEQFERFLAATSPAPEEISAAPEREPVKEVAVTTPPPPSSMAAPAAIAPVPPLPSLAPLAMPQVDSFKALPILKQLYEEIEPYTHDGLERRAQLREAITELEVTYEMVMEMARKRLSERTR